VAFFVFIFSVWTQQINISLSALELAGYSHYIPMGRPQVVIGSSRNEWLSNWSEKLDFGVDILNVRPKILLVM
jgi:hypothetical protein